MISKAARNLELYFSGTVEEKLEVSRNLYRRHSHEILQLDYIKKNLSRLDEYEKILTRQMSIMDMGGRCSNCAATSGGCCSAYMAANSDAILLLINMLLEVDVIYRYNRKECCFLGRSGCILIIKPIFCLNYNCSQIQSSYPLEQMQELERLTAQLLGEQVILEGMLLECL